MAAREHPHVGDEPAAAAHQAHRSVRGPVRVAFRRRRVVRRDRTNRAPTPRRCPPYRTTRSRSADIAGTGSCRAWLRSAGSSRKLAVLRSRRSPHGYRLDSAPPRAAFSHSASVGRRNSVPAASTARRSTPPRRRSGRASRDDRRVRAADRSRSRHRARPSGGTCARARCRRRSRRSAARTPPARDGRSRGRSGEYSALVTGCTPR